MDDSRTMPCPFCGRGSARGGLAEHEGDCFIALVYQYCDLDVYFPLEEWEARWRTRRERTCAATSLGGIDGRVPLFLCSECGRLWYGGANGDPWAYCPNCGARAVG